MIAPDLELYSGQQFTTKSNFGIFQDSYPDRWGRRLIIRREKIRANKEGRPPQNLQESDFLLGVYDQTRMGALRYKTHLEGNF